MIPSQYERLAKLAVESLLDNGGNLAQFLDILKAEAKFQADRAKRESDDYTTEELEAFDELIAPVSYTRLPLALLPTHRCPAAGCNCQLGLGLTFCSDHMQEVA